jgi:hypothetical protein
VHHTSKGMDPESSDAPMAASAIRNSSRLGGAIVPMSLKEAME